jgi:hypothetical protein
MGSPKEDRGRRVSEPWREPAPPFGTSSKATRVTGLAAAEAPGEASKARDTRRAATVLCGVLIAKFPGLEEHDLTAHALGRAALPRAHRAVVAATPSTPTSAVNVDVIAGVAREVTVLVIRSIKSRLAVCSFSMLSIPNEVTHAFHT